MVLVLILAAALFYRLNVRLHMRSYMAEEDGIGLPLLSALPNSVG